MSCIWNETAIGYITDQKWEAKHNVLVTNTENLSELWCYYDSIILNRYYLPYRTIYTFILNEAQFIWYWLSCSDNFKRFWALYFQV